MAHVRKAARQAVDNVAKKKFTSFAETTKAEFARKCQIYMGKVTKNKKKGKGSKKGDAAAADEDKSVWLGRLSNTLSMGLIGMPNVGKSTTFNALSKLNVPADNYPFCTKDPNVANV